MFIYLWVFRCLSSGSIYDNQPHPGFELVSPYPFPTTIAIIPREPPKFLNINSTFEIGSWQKLFQSCKNIFWGYSTRQQIQCNPNIRELSGPENKYLISGFGLFGLGNTGSNLEPDKIALISGFLLYPGYTEYSRFEQRSYQIFGCWEVETMRNLKKNVWIEVCHEIFASWEVQTVWH